MEFKDRTGQHLNRKKLTIISQTPNELIVDMDRFDNVTEEGTKINANVFNTFQTEITTANNNANNAVSAVLAIKTEFEQTNANSQTALTTANSADLKAEQAIEVSNVSNTKADSAIDTANSAITKSDEATISSNTALNNSNEALSTANNAKSESATANTNSSIALTNSQTAIQTANDANSTANTALTNSNNAIDTANDAKSIAEVVKNEMADRGATVYFGEEPQLSVRFNSDPQTQLNNKIEKAKETSTTLSSEDLFVVQKSNSDENYNVSVKTLASTIFPVGAIYMSVNSTNPGEIFGGVWESWGAGRVPIGIGDNGETNYTTAEATGGSENSVALHTHIQEAHTHTQPEHTHTFIGNSGSVWNIAAGTDLGANGGFKIQAGVNNPTYGRGGTYSTDYKKISYQPSGTNTSFSPQNELTIATNNNTGIIGGNRQPYITCYMWKRIA